jgi:hypothetical protein
MGTRAKVTTRKTKGGGSVTTYTLRGKGPQSRKLPAKPVRSKLASKKRDANSVVRASEVRGFGDADAFRKDIEREFGKRR